MAADDLALGMTRPPVTKVLTMQDKKGSLYYSRKGFNFLCLLNFEKWYKMQIYFNIS